MNSNNDIKVTFINSTTNNLTEKIRIFFKDIFNNDIQIDLRPGEFVYSQTNHISNSLRIYSRKGIIEIIKETKPDFLKYYVGYKQEEIDDKYFLYKLQNSLKKDESKKPTESQAKIDIETTMVTENIRNTEIKETIVDKAIKEVKKYSERKKKTTKSKSKRGPGRPKKRGPKKGSKRKKMEE